MLTIINLGAEKDLLAAIDKAASILLTLDCNVCGLDTEKTVENALTQEEVYAMRKGDSINRTGPSILQLCVKGDVVNPLEYTSVKTVEIPGDVAYICFIFPLLRVRLEKEKDQNRVIYPKSLKKLLAYKSIAKVGADIKGDVRTLEDTYGFSINSSLDIQDIATSFGMADSSLESLAMKFLGKGKLTGEKHEGNYNGMLSDIQVLYAGYDAYLSLKVYEAFFISSRRIKVSSAQQEVVKVNLTTSDYNDMIMFIRVSSTIPFVKDYVSEDAFFENFYTGYKKWRQDKTKPEIQALSASFINRALKEGFLVEDQNRPKMYKISPKDVAIQLRNAVEDYLVKNVSRTQGAPRNTILNKLIEELAYITLPAGYDKSNMVENIINSLINKKVIKLTGGGNKIVLNKTV